MAAERKPSPPAGEVELDVTNVAHGGVFVARHDGRVVFVADTLPGERVLARISDDRHASFWRAETLRVLEPAAERRPHVWAEASVDRDPAQRAGGAEFGHIDPAFQRELKRRVLTDALQRFGGVESSPVQVEAVAPADASSPGWRTRVRLQVAEDGTVGPYAARSHRVIPVESLPLAVAAVQRIAPLDRRFAGMAHVDVIAPSASEPGIVVAELDPRGRPRRTAEPRQIRERVGEREFRLDETGFWQVHARAAETLTDAVQSAIDADRFDPAAANLDLYGGVGMLAAAVGDRFGRSVRITSVEADAAATDHAAENLADWVGASAITARVDRHLDRLVRSASASERERLRRATVVLDPPRAGAGREVVDAIAELAPAQLVYVACDPVALARDTGLLRRHGYELAGIRAFDLFPDTHHVEAVARFVSDRSA